MTAPAPELSFLEILTAPPTRRRYAIRCRDCLTVAFAELDANEAAVAHECSACAGRIEIMGEVFGALIGRREYCSACDDRCTNAKGPNCDCPCGGKNHGSGAVVEVKRITGKAPVATMRAKVACLKAAEEWRAMVRQYDAKVATAGPWVRSTARRMRLDAASKRTHAARLRIMRECLDWLASK